MLGMHGEIESEDLNVPAKYKDMVDQLVCVGTAMTDTIMNIDRALDHFRKEGHYVNKANMEEVFDTVGYIINDFYEYPKERMYGTYSEILDVDFGKLSSGLPKDNSYKLE